MGPKWIFGLASGASLFIAMPAGAQQASAADSRNVDQFHQADVPQSGAEMLARFRDKAAAILAQRPAGPEQLSVQTWAGIDRERLENDFRLSAERPVLPERSMLRSFAASLSVGRDGTEQRGISFGLDQTMFQRAGFAVADPASVRTSQPAEGCPGMMPAFNCSTGRDTSGAGLRLALAYSF